MDNTVRSTYGDILANWSIPEYQVYKKDSSWFLFAGVGIVVMMGYAFFTNNFLFAVIIVISAFILIIRGKEPAQVDFTIFEDGVAIGNKFYEYSKFKDFAIVYKPEEKVKNIYFEFSNLFFNRLSIPLEDNDPLLIREILVKYLAENKEMIERPTSENLARLFKI